MIPTYEQAWADEMKLLHERQMDECRRIQGPTLIEAREMSARAWRRSRPS